MTELETIEGQMNAFEIALKDENERLRAESKRLYEIARNYCDPFNMLPEDCEYLDRLMEKEWAEDQTDKEIPS